MAGSAGSFPNPGEKGDDEEAADKEEHPIPAGVLEGEAGPGDAEPATEIVEHGVEGVGPAGRRLRV